MYRLVDLSHAIVDGLPAYPGDMETKLYQTSHLEKDKYNNHTLETTMHSGTHIDSPMHLTESSRFIGQYPLECFIGEGCLLDVRGGESIKMKEEYREIVGKGSIVLLYTGWDSKFGTDGYFTGSPAVDMELAGFFAERGVKMVGMDMPSPDNPPFEIHKILFKNNILIIENLANLKSLLCVKHFEVIAFPLRVMADSSIARVAARILEP